MLLLSSQAALGQGLVTLQNGAGGFKDEAPFSATAAVGGGYDSIRYASPGIGDLESIFIQGNAGLQWAEQSELTPYLIGIDGGVVQYLDAAAGDNDTNYTVRARANVTHNVSERLQVSNNFFLTYEVEPNFGMGFSTARRNGQYLYGYNNFNASYAWSERFSTVTSYTADGIRYDDSTLADAEDRLSHLISQQFRYAVTERTKLVAEYRYRITNFRTRSDNDFRSHFILAGVDRAWSERSTVSVRAGAEMYSSNRTDTTAPYFEANLVHQASEKTTLNAYAAVGYEGAELGNFAARYNYRAGFNAEHRLTERLTLNSGLNYVHSEFEGQGNASTVNEDQVNATIGAQYNLTDSMALNANYTHALISSDDSLREYDRDRIFLGVSATF
jgi:Putative beta-barrel porin 2